MIKKIKLEDAAAMSALHKRTFKIPSNAELANLKSGNLVKVNSNGERFWCEIISVENGIIIGRVDNDLLNPNLDLDDLIEIKAENIYTIFEE